MEEPLSFILDFYYSLVMVGKEVKEKGARAKEKKVYENFLKLYDHIWVFALTCTDFEILN